MNDNLINFDNILLQLCSKNKTTNVAYKLLKKLHITQYKHIDVNKKKYYYKIKIFSDGAMLYKKITLYDDEIIKNIINIKTDVIPYDIYKNMKIINYVKRHFRIIYRNNKVFVIIDDKIIIIKNEKKNMFYKLYSEDE